MSRIAQILCDEIVEPALHRSIENDERKYSNTNKCISRPNKQDSKTTRTILVEKRRVINKLVPNDLSASRTKFKCKETLLKKTLADTAVNTMVSGPLRCDNDCVTMVRKRDNKCTCRCAQKRLNYKVSAKNIQTFDSKNFSLTDKACAQCIETASCGTQFLQKISSTMKPQISSGTKKSYRDSIQPSSREFSRVGLATSSNFGRSSISSYMGARRWALSQYPTRGPDF